MFTTDQIKSAHSKVQSGADFPAYIREIRQLGVVSYTISVADGSAHYHGKDGHSTSSELKYPELEIASIANPEQFLRDLKSHQQGHSNYLTFCRQSAQSGVSKWTVDIQKLTCTYFDRSDSKILTEQIPV